MHEADAVVQAEGLGYKYPSGVSALEEATFQIMRGESVVFLGPNGAGKSTLLLNLCGALKGEGRVEIFGKAVAEKKRGELIREIGLVFQHPDDQLFMPTLFDDVAFGPNNMGLSAEEVKMRAEEALAEVGMSGYGQRMPHTLSFGEKKKAALATVLSMKPEILLLDEPTANLDPRSRRELLATLKRLKAEGKTIIVSTHDVEVVPEIADKVYVLKKKIVAEGTPKKIFLDTELLSEMNLEVPPVARLFQVLSCFGYDPRSLPLSMDEAAEHLTQTMETSGGHMHLHIHQHTHSQLEKLKEKHEHQ